jgi:hypothetical protein
MACLTFTFPAVVPRRDNQASVDNGTLSTPLHWIWKNPNFVIIIPFPSVGQHDNPLTNGQPAIASHASLAGFSLPFT